MNKKRKVNQLTDKELAKLAKVLAVFEDGIFRETGVKSRNGGFATASMFNYDDDAIDIEVQWGIQCGSSDDYTHVENWELAREELSSDKSISEIVECIDS